jgi:tetratricopeptide (TPR) repeat protein
MKKVAFIKTVILIIIFVNIFTVSLKLKLFADLNNIEQKIEQIKITIANLPKDFSTKTVDNLILLCNDVINYEPKNIDAYIYLAVCYYLKRNIDKGIEILSKSLIFDSKNANVYFLRGYGYYGKAKKIEKHNERISYLNRAIIDFNKTLSLEQNYQSIKVQNNFVEVTGVMFYVGICYKLKGDLVKAKETFQIIIDKYPNGDWAPEAKKEMEYLLQNEVKTRK